MKCHKSDEFFNFLFVTGEMQSQTGYTVEQIASQFFYRNGLNKTKAFPYRI